MIRLLPTSSEQTISVIPRKLNYISIVDFQKRVPSPLEAIDCLTEAIDEFNDTSIYIRRDGDGKDFTTTDVESVINGDFVDFSFSSDIFVEGSGYSIEITEGVNLIYRDKIYVTTQTNTDVYHTISPNYYEENDTDGDDKYITI